MEPRAFENSTPSAPIMILRRFAILASRYLLLARCGLKRRLGLLGPLQILAYRTYGNSRELFVRGRVVERKAVRPSRETDGMWRNLCNAWRGMSRLPVPGARVAAEFQGRRSEAVADDRGFFELRLRPSAPLEPLLWQIVPLELLEPRPNPWPVEALAQVLTLPGTARHVVISDIDDTVVPTHATSALRMLRSLFLHNARTRLPFPGLAAFYRALHLDREGHPANPMLYVSRGPWSLYDLLAEFFGLHGIPVGPVLFLRDWGLSEEGLTRPSPTGHKFKLITAMLELYDDLPFILMGDSGQLDPEIYAEIVERHPGRVHAVYIRLARPDQVREQGVLRLAEDLRQSGSELVLARDTMEMAVHAAERGWIEAWRLADIAGEKAAAEEPPGLLDGMHAGHGRKTAGKDEPPDRGRVE
ncbi:App1 family protein [Desulfocurvibacter africanus]|uniref:Phosphatidate phosphatase APP1 catalytic domain-containing protein n=1 Tax=Desulfocurvibacter africanus subsp. africanus str. Walvis Bay TaxID=690850 RepID=F3YVR7_DESAF|nr:phosphatase domain-containing protein [Desulfocurvibacter africanus]EGJ48875.1 Protein of unknown function DUF2183 [Desulfocurvibacter africanus subsp. africanus str. Walvis Bay]